MSPQSDDEGGVPTAQRSTSALAIDGREDGAQSPGVDVRCPDGRVTRAGSFDQSHAAWRRTVETAEHGGDDGAGPPSSPARKESETNLPSGETEAIRTDAEPTPSHSS